MIGISKIDPGFINGSLKTRLRIACKYDIFFEYIVLTLKLLTLKKISKEQRQIIKTKNSIPILKNNEVYV